MTAVTWLAGPDAWHTRGRAPLPFDPGSGPVDPGPPDDPPPAPHDWEAAFTSQHFPTVEAWYQANTGLARVGATAADLTPGSLVSQYDGQVIEGVLGGAIKFRHNDVTIRNCRAETTGAGYAVSFDKFSTDIRGCRLENTDIEFTPVAPDHETRHAMILINGTSGADSTRALTVSHCDISGYTSSGGRLGNNVTQEYCYVHHFQYPVGPHANSCRPVGHNVEVTRNLFTEGRSAIASIYFDDRPLSNVTFEENILYGAPGSSASYWVNGKGGEYRDGGVNIVWRNNRYGGHYQFGEWSSSVRWGELGNQHYGDRYFDTGQLVPWNH